jgi:putative SOS response-associated peptidase YedK
VDSFTIITTTPNALLAPIHDRMPAILPSPAFDEWLDGTNRDPERLGALLGPYPAEELDAYPVSRYVNKPSNEGPECVTPAT